MALAAFCLQGMFELRSTRQLRREQETGESALLHNPSTSQVLYVACKRAAWEAGLKSAVVMGN